MKITREPIRVWLPSEAIGATWSCVQAVAVALPLTLMSYTAPARAQQPTYADFPVVVYCEYQGITSAYYFSQLADGLAVYLTPDRQVGVITIDSTALRIGGDRPGTCLDKTLDELRASGQAFDLPR
jgi:hypothetical protein